MMPEAEAGGDARREGPVKAGRKRARRRAPPRGAGTAQPIVHVMQLVAALKAEQEAGSPLALAKDADERVKLMGWLRRFLAARDEERTAWEGRIRDIETRLCAAQAAGAAARAAAEQEAVQHQRLVSDLKLMHEHQRSIWQLERRRLEITLDGLQQARGGSMRRRAARLSRPAVVAALLLASLAAVALSADSHAVAPSAPLYLDDGSRAAIIVLGAD
jgi:hypothetical protein